MGAQSAPSRSSIPTGFPRGILTRPPAESTGADAPSPQAPLAEGALRSPRGDQSSDPAAGVTDEVPIWAGLAPGELLALAAGVARSLRGHGSFLAVGSGMPSRQGRRIPAVASIPTTKVRREKLTGRPATTAVTRDHRQTAIPHNEGQRRLETEKRQTRSAGRGSAQRSASASRPASRQLGQNNVPTRKRPTPDGVRRSSCRIQCVRSPVNRIPAGSAQC